MGKCIHQILWQKGKTKMITCRWCGTNYITFQSNCKNCGGPIQGVEWSSEFSALTSLLPEPPPAPRPISKKYLWWLLSTDSWSITALVFCVLGVVFGLVGAGLTIGIINAFVGIPFLLLGIAFLGIGGYVFTWRYQEMQQVVNVLRDGEATHGQIIEIRENLSVRINGQHPWIIKYQFQVNGQNQEGKVTTLNPPRQPLQAGNTVNILYLPTSPKWNSIYPHPKIQYIQPKMN
jgi:hypothetical protein